jgi:hypothetical protein
LKEPPCSFPANPELRRQYLSECKNDDLRERYKKDPIFRKRMKDYSIEYYHKNKVEILLKRKELRQLKVT